MGKHERAIEVTVERHGYKKQPYTFTINLPGPSKPEQHDQRYSTPSNARRKSRALLGAYGGPKTYYATVKGTSYPIEFKFIDRRKKK